MKYLTLAILLLAAMLCGCSDDDENIPVTPVETIDTLYVDASNTQPGDGTQADPFNTITAALAVASTGDEIQIAAGNYDTDETFPLVLKPGLKLIGTGNTTTRINGTIVDSLTGNDPIQLQGLSFTEFTFKRPAATGVVSGTNRITNCRAFGGISFQHGGGHNALVDSSTVTGYLRFFSAAGASVNVVRYNSVGGEIAFGNGSGANDTIRNNNVNGIIDYKSAASNAIINENNVVGNIVEASGEGVQIIADNTVLYHLPVTADDSAAITSTGSSATITGNNIYADQGASGIRANAGPTTVDSNVIEVDGTGLGIYANFGGNGHIVGNTISGGNIGIFSSSAATLVAHNAITGCVTGVYTSDAARYSNNSISICTGDGYVNYGGAGPVDSNTIINNGGAGFRNVMGTIDLGGGADNCPGWNVFTGNGNYDLYNEYSQPLKAENNSWDHADSLDIDTLDVYDDDENGSVGAVDFMPIRTTGGTL